MNGAHGEIVGFKWSDGADHQAQPGILPAAVFVKFHDPRVGRIHSIPVPGCDSEAVEIRPIPVNSLPSKVLPYNELSYL